jgi:hypothetical protein
VGWANKGPRHLLDYWGRILRVEDAEELALFDPRLASISDDYPEDLLEELRLI